MKPIKLIIILACVIAITAGITAYIHSFVTIVGTMEQPYNFSITPDGAVGLLVDTGEIIQFGEPVPGTTVTRYFEVANGFDHPIKIEQKATGEAGDWISGSGKVIQVGETEKVPIHLTVPEGVPFGKHYEGKIITYLIKV